MPHANDCPRPETLSRYLQGNVTEEEAATLDSHLVACPPCLGAIASAETAVNFHADTDIGRIGREAQDLDGLKRRLVNLIRLESANSLVEATRLADADLGAVDLASLEYRALLLPVGEGETGIGRIGRYLVRQLVGSGGMGYVFLAHDPTMKRNVALKIMKPALAAVKEHKQRFLREAQATAAVRNDHVVEIYRVDEDRGIPFLEMPLLEGETLKSRLEREGRLPVSEVLRIGREIASGLSAAHAKGLIHRDVKPGNIWLESGTGRAKILDFGLALDVESDLNLTSTGAILGTVPYMSPEQAARRGRQLDARSDLFSLGSVMYEMATGVVAFQRANTFETLDAVVREMPEPPREIHSAVSPALSALIMQLLAKEPEQRPANAAAVIGAVDQIQALQVAREPSRVATSSSSGKKPSAARWIIAAVGAICVLMAVMIIKIKDKDGKVVQEVQVDVPEGGSIEKGEKLAPPAPDYAADVRAAEFLLKNGGRRVSVYYPSGVKAPNGLDANTGIPRNDFYIEAVGIGQAPLGEVLELLKVLPNSHCRALWLDGYQASDAELAEIGKVPSVTDLDLSENQKLTDAVLQVLPDNIGGLSLNRTAVTDAGLTQLGRFKSLNSLRMNDTNVTNEGLKRISEHTNLNYLGLRGTKVTDAGLPSLQAMKRLIDLDVSSTGMTSAALLQLRDQPQLNSLQLACLDVGDEILPLLLSRQPLQRVDLNYTRVSKKAYDQIKHAFPQVEIYWYEENFAIAQRVLEAGGTVSIRQDGSTVETELKAIAELPSEKFELVRVNLQNVDSAKVDEVLDSLAQMPPRPDGAPRLQSMLSVNLVGTKPRRFTPLALYTDLQELDLSGTNFSDANVNDLKPLKHLRRLALNGTELRGASFAQLREIPELVDLRLGCPTLTDTFIGDLVEIKSLSHLSLAGSGISDTCVGELAKMTQLKELDLSNTKLSLARIDELKKALPNCKVTAG